MKILFYLLLLLLFALPSAHAAGPGVVSETATAIRYRQPDGLEVTLPKHPKRVVIGYGSLVPVWYCAGGTAIAIPDIHSKTALPPEARSLPSVGFFSSLNIEKILELKPELVVLMGKIGSHVRLRELLATMKIPAFTVKYDNYRDFEALLDLFCRLNNTDPERCEAARTVTEGVNRIVAQAGQYPAPRFTTVFAQAAGFRAETDLANTSCMLSMLGGKNTVPPSGGLRTGFSIEQLLLDNPDVIFVVMMGNTQTLEEKFRKEIMSQPAWKKLRADQTGRVHFLPSDLYLYLAGPRFPEAFLHLAQLLYPGREFTR